MRYSVIASLLLMAVVQALPYNKRGTGVEISVNSEGDFCSYLPPDKDLSVSETETNASPFCSSARDYASAFPPGFILSAHFLRTDTYSQITGRIDHTKYGIKTEDGGGQYDNKDLPNGTCNGLKHWVNLIEPDSDTFCIRCCREKADCNTGISTKGCEHIVPGIYT